MNALITLDEAVRHLRIDELDSDGDPDLELKIFAASQAVINYLGDYASEIVDSDGDVILDTDGVSIAPYPIKAATLLMLGYLYKDRDENADGAYEMGFLPKPVTALLYPYRDPALA